MRPERTWHVDRFLQTPHHISHHLMLYLVHSHTMQVCNMRTTVTLDDDLVSRAQALTGIEEKAALVREGLNALIEREAARRLAALGGSDPDAKAAPRRRSEIL